MLTVDPRAIAQNWRTFARLAAPAECAAVVKAGAYGVGLDLAAPALADAGTRTFYVASLGEALQLRALLGPGVAIVALAGLDVGPQPFLDAAITPVVNNVADARVWAGVSAPCAVHLDTGMSRLGAPPEEDAAIVAALRPGVVSIVMSHLACAGTPDDPMNPRQRERFVARAAAFPNAARSLAATAGCVLGPAYRLDQVRVGLGLYGGGASPLEPPLSPTVLFAAPILQVRHLQPGDVVGYDSTFHAPGPMRAATVAAGYADGVLRSLSGRGYAVVGGRRCPVLGRISMDLITIDVSAAGDAAHVGAMAELVGPSAPLSEVAALAGTIPYEVLTSLGHTARRTGSLT